MNQFVASDDTAGVVSHPVLGQIMIYGIIAVVALFMLVGLGRVVGLTLANRKQKDDEGEQQ